MDAGVDLGEAEMKELEALRSEGFDWTSWDEFVRLGGEKKLGRTADGEILWKRMEFDWPIWILFSSGTTG